MSGKRILVVEDDAGLRHYIHTLLEAASYEVDSCPNGVEPLVRMQRHPSDLVVTRLSPLTPDGIGTVYEVRRWFPGVPIVVYVRPGPRSAEETELLQLLRPDAVLVMPLPAEILDAVARLVTGKDKR